MGHLCLWGHLWDICGTSIGHLWDIFETSMGHLWDIYGTSMTIHGWRTPHPHPPHPLHHPHGCTWLNNLEYDKQTQHQREMTEWHRKGDDKGSVLAQHQFTACNQP